MLRQGMAAIKKAMEIWIFKGDSPSFQALLEALNGAEARLNKLVDANMGWSKSVFAWILIKLGRIKKMFGGCLDAHFKTERAQ
jgi:hypothetical protein